MNTDILANARGEIAAEVDNWGPYSHNIVGIILRSIANEFGTGAANDLVEEFDLEERGFNKE